MGTILLTSIVGHAATGSGMVIGDNATLRSGSNLNGSAIQSLPIGTEINISALENDFYQVDVKSDNINGWIHKDLVLPDKGILNEKVRKGIITARTLNIRSGPSTEHSQQGQLKQDQEIQIVGEKSEWYQIKDERGVNGWIHSDYVKLIPNLPRAYIKTDSANVYTHTDKNAGILEVLKKEQVFFIKNYQDGWYRVETNSGIEGWILRKQVSLIVNGNGPVSRGGARSSLNGMIGITEKYLGSPYRYAATGPSQFDCSGFVYYILHEYYGQELRENSINLPRSSRHMANVGETISRDQLQIGDLVFFNNGSSNRINHVGFYIGGNNFIHASSGSNMSVIVSSLNANNYNRRYSTAKRLF